MDEEGLKADASQQPRRRASVRQWFWQAEHEADAVRFAIALQRFAAKAGQPALTSLAKRDVSCPTSVRRAPEQIIAPSVTILE